MAAKELLQCVIGARQVVHFVAVEQSRPIASADFAKMIHGIAQVADAGSMPRHSADQSAQLPPRCAGIDVFGAQDMRRLTDPTKHHLQAAAKNRRSRPSRRQSNP